VRSLRFLAALGSLAWLGLSLQWFRGIRRVPVLEDLDDPSSPDRYPALCVVFAARDEERSVEESVESMLTQDYPGELEVIAVDDRSTDRTGEILEQLATKHPGRLGVLSVETLPAGWLGKTHALHLGATRAAGEWLLFTDADVRFSPTCLERAVRHATGERLDHLTLTPEIVCRGILLRGFVAVFALVFEITQRPWRASNPRAQEHVGVGAFNLIKADAYEKIGTHRAIRMRPDDDMKLAKLVKDHGMRQGVAYGTGLVAVEWHQTLRGAVRGLSKSMFPAVDYRIDATVAGVLALVLTNVLPLFGLFSRGAVRALSWSSILSTFLLYAYRARHSRMETPWWYAALHPFGVGVFVYAMLRSAGTTIINQGIEWRGTRYPLESLRANARVNEGSG
jgi:cellulose synthase/poly-beta-1,6-N-acetylglucosamine synthase-like glycosyltransferase